MGKGNELLLFLQNESHIYLRGKKFKERKKKKL